MSTGTAVDVVMPQMGVSVSEGTITRWAKQVGEHVNADETIVEISTDKVDTEVPSPGSGIVTEILVAEGETVDVGTRIAVISSGDGATAEAPPAPAPPAPAASPAVRRLPRLPQQLHPRPPSRPMTRTSRTATATARRAASCRRSSRAWSRSTRSTSRRSPARAAAAASRSATWSSSSPVGTARRRLRSPRQRQRPLRHRLQRALPLPHLAAAGAAAPAPRPAIATGSVSWGVEESSPLSTIRKVIARNMRASIETAAHVTSVSEVDMTRVVNIRKELNPQFQRDYGVKVSFMPFIMRAVIEAIPHWPWVNAELRGDAVVVKKYVNLGVAVAIDDSKGLVVPVIHNAEEKNLLGLTRALIDLADRARKKQLTVDEMSGGSFTITNPGVFGALFGTPIIPPPQVAIIDVEAIVKRPVVVTDEFGNDSIGIRSMMYLPISYDHRLIDGAYAAQFMQQVKKNLETFGAADYGA